MVELAQKLAGDRARQPSPRRVYFGNSGTEAVEAAIKLARYHTRRDKIIAFYGAFHGRTMGALSLTASKAVQRAGFGALLSGVFHVPYANPYRCPYGSSRGFLLHRVRPVSRARALHAKLWIPRKSPPSSSSRFRVKAATSRRPTRFFADLQRSAAATAFLLITDEVQSGMGRTGKWWAGDHAAIEPDILCVAKGIASGLPLSATIANASLMDWPPGAHASTFGGNPVCVAAALVTFRLLEDSIHRKCSPHGRIHLRASRGLAWKIPHGRRRSRDAA